MSGGLSQGPNHELIPVDPQVAGDVVQLGKRYAFVAELFVEFDGVATYTQAAGAVIPSFIEDGPIEVTSST